MEVPQEIKNVTVISPNNATFGYIAKGKNSHKISQNNNLKELSILCLQHHYSQ